MVLLSKNLILISFPTHWRGNRLCFWLPSPSHNTAEPSRFMVRHAVENVPIGCCKLCTATEWAASSRRSFRYKHVMYYKTSTCGRCYYTGTRCNIIAFLFMLQSIVMLMFREEKSPEDEIKAWQFWHGRQHSVKQRILDAGKYI